MNPPAWTALRQDGILRAAMMSRTAAWQCAVRLHGFSLTCVMSLADALTGATTRVERTIPRHKAVSPGADGGFTVVGKAFQLSLRQDRGAWYLSGSIEDARLNAWLWDIRLGPGKAPNGLPLYQAAGRLASPAGETLFPPIQSFLAWDDGLRPPRLAAWGNDPKRLLFAGADTAVLDADGSGPRRLPALHELRPTDTGWTCRFEEAAPDLALDAWSLPASDAFRLPMAHGAVADTRFGFWRGDWPLQLRNLPGFITFVI